MDITNGASNGSNGNNNGNKSHANGLTSRLKRHSADTV